MRQIKSVLVVAVDAIPSERSGIGQDVPAHIKLQWKDEQGRRVSLVLDLTPQQVEEISRIP